MIWGILKTLSNKKTLFKIKALKKKIKTLIQILISTMIIKLELLQEESTYKRQVRDKNVLPYNFWKKKPVNYCVVCWNKTGYDF